MQENPEVISKKEEKPVPALDELLGDPRNDDLFYTASVHFLRKQLQAKSSNVSFSPQDFSQSCCELSASTSFNIRNDLDNLRRDEGPILNGSLKPFLPMHEVLPYPRSGKTNFFSRLKHTFRKYKRSSEVTGKNILDDLENTNCISTFKFPRCERVDMQRSSFLVRISEEGSLEDIEDEMSKDMIQKCKSSLQNRKRRSKS